MTYSDSPVIPQNPIKGWQPYNHPSTLENTTPKVEHQVAAIIQLQSGKAEPLSRQPELMNHPAVDRENLPKEIEDSFVFVSKFPDNLEKIAKKAQKSQTSDVVSTTIQIWISDIVLKGLATSARSAVPFILNPSDSIASDLVQSTEIIKIFSDVIDFGTGAATILVKHYALDAAKKELQRLKEEESLDAVQFARLHQLERMVNYESEKWDSRFAEQMLRTIKNILSFGSFTLSWLEKSPLVTSITGASGALISGVNAALAGLFFYRAHCNLASHREWSNDFNNWVEKQTVIVTLPDEKAAADAILAQTSENLKKIEVKRQQREQMRILQMIELQDRLERKEIEIDQVHKRIIDIKRPGLHQFLSSFNMREISPEILRNELEQQYGVAILEPQLYRNLHAAYLSGNSEAMPALHDECLKIWIAGQKEDVILSTYIDFHAVLDPTIKSALTEMVAKKHDVEQSFLEMKRFQFGAKFTAGTIIFGVAVTLLIIALVANPIGAAALILTLLTLGSFALSLGLMGASYYQGLSLKPRLTTAMLKGEFVRLYYYHTRAILSHLNHKIDAYCRDKVDNLIQTLRGVDQLKAKQLKETTPHPDEEAQLSRAYEWRQRAKILQRRLDRLAWLDFAERADLKVATHENIKEFDTLNTLNHLITHCDFSLLSDETKQMFEKQLGIDTKALEQRVRESPVAVKQLLQNFFVMNDDAFVQFIGEQKFLTA